MRFEEACTSWQEQAADAGRSGAKGFTVADVA
jgi:hypothetical protein